MKTYNAFFTLIFLGFLVIFLWNGALSQSFTEIYFINAPVNPPEEAPVSFIQILFNSPDKIYGTGFADNERTGRQKIQKILSGDTTKKDNKAEVRESENGDEYIVILDLLDYSLEIKISVYNMLAKKVLDVFEGIPKDKQYKIDASNLPNGIYICVVQGKSFRLAQKFIVSR